MFTLAGHLKMTVAELGSRMSHREFREWVEFYRIDPFGPERADFMLAQLCALIANVNRPRRSSRRFRIADFMPRFHESQRPRQSLGEMVGKLRAIATTHNARLGLPPSGVKGELPSP